MKYFIFCLVSFHNYFIGQVGHTTALCPLTSLHGQSLEVPLALLCQAFAAVIHMMYCCLAQLLIQLHGLKLYRFRMVALRPGWHLPIQNS